MTRIRRQRDELTRTYTEQHPPLLSLPIDTQPWMADALCAQTDPELFFPIQGASNRAALKVCAHCPVTKICLTYALDHAEAFGIWGGTTWTQRRRLTRTAGEPR
jgi:WhiB family redox-sensing transcriptional regulator